MADIVIDPKKQETFDTFHRQKVIYAGGDYNNPTVMSFSNFKNSAGEPIGDKVAQMIANFLKAYCYEIYTITILLDNCGITDKGVEILFGALFNIYKNKPIKITIERISLQNNPITTKGVDYIMSILQSGETFYEGCNKTHYYSIKKIDLCGIQMTTADNEKYHPILYDYYINRAKREHGEELWTGWAHLPKAHIMEEITPEIIMTGICIDWQMRSIH